MELTNKNITIVGLGRTSLSLAELLMAKGAAPRITEIRTQGECGELVEQAEALGVDVEFGGHSEAAFAEAHIVVPSPGVPPTIPPITEAESRGIPVMGEMELASQFSTSRIIAVTGTNGKTTTTALIHAMLEACGCDVALAGNNDVPFSHVLLQEAQPEYLVLEVSSYQLETASTFHPWIAAVLNLSNDHLGRHKTMENYAAVKAKIFANQGAGDVAIVNIDDPWVRDMPAPNAAHKLTVSLESAAGLCIGKDSILIDNVPVAELADIPLKGRHNHQNVLVALAAVHAGGFPMDKALQGLREFSGVEHRIEFVDEIDGVSYYNDSKATNLDSLKVALESFEQPVVLVAGGEGKGSDYTSLSQLIAERVAALILFGADAQAMADAWGNAVPATVVPAMRQAVNTAAKTAHDKEIRTVLLSPACASFDQYTNFEERGGDFKACVAALKTGTHAANSTS